MFTQDKEIPPLILPLWSCADPKIVGGKAAGLGTLLREGFDVLPGWCLTTHAYDEMERIGGQQYVTESREMSQWPEQDRIQKIEEVRRSIESWSLSPALVTLLHSKLANSQTDSPELLKMGWAVRSSATYEDGINVSFAGIFKTELGVRREDIPSAVVKCWASVWTPAMFEYLRRLAAAPGVPKMAVLFQPMLNPTASGVAYSCHPLTGQRNLVSVNAVFGLAEPLVAGTTCPDHFALQIEEDGQGPVQVERRIAKKATWRRMRREGAICSIRDEALPLEKQAAPVLQEQDVVHVAKVVRAIEKIHGFPVDVEWAIDASMLWIMQARPIAHGTSAHEGPEQQYGWSRANLKETLPDLPSPLALDFLIEYMESAIMRHYREVGCRLPEGVPTIRIVNGRPYINVTLFQIIIVQLRGDPNTVAEQMGGELGSIPESASPLPWGMLLTAACRIVWRIVRANRIAPTRFKELRKAGDVHRSMSFRTHSPQQICASMEAFRSQLPMGDLTFAVSAGVSQLLTSMGDLLKKRVPKDWRSVLNASTQGFGGIISAKQVVRLMELAKQAQEDSEIHHALVSPSWDPQDILRMSRSSPFRMLFDEYLLEYGHRAIGESDVMTPRLSETPEYVLGIVRGYLLAGTVQSPKEVMAQQTRVREQALTTIREACGWQIHEWLWFRLLHAKLSTYFELREANRHWLIYYLAGVRSFLLDLGNHFAKERILKDPEDIFFLTQDELLLLVGQAEQDWHSIIAGRRKERDEFATKTSPDMIHAQGNRATRPSWSRDPEKEQGRVDELEGLSISAGFVEGRVKIVYAPTDVGRIHSGDILVLAVLDPGWAPLLGLARGLIVEMGGTLSHGAIIAREFGIPTIVNVVGAKKLLQDGEWVALDATRGIVTKLNKNKEE